MKVLNLTANSKVYTSNAYYILGDWKAISDTNTLVDVGNDPGIIDIIEKTNAGLGKNKIDQVILTHSHSDHVGILPLIIEKYQPKIFAFNNHVNGVTDVLKDGQIIKIGETRCEVFHITVHSYDSICIYCEENGVLFAGDTFFPVDFDNELLKAENAFPLSRLERKTIKNVFYGHGKPHEYDERRFIAYKRHL